MTKHWTILRIREGAIANKKAIQELFRQLKDGNYLIEINAHNKRSTQQNRYYHGVVVPMIQHGIRDLGTELTHEECHDFLKAKFNYSEVVNPETGQVEQIPRTTTTLNKEQFASYIEKIQQFASEFLGIYIPSPNEQLTIDV